MAITWKSNSQKRSENFKKINNLLKKRKEENPSYKVLDVGGAANPWAEKYIDAYVDFNEVPGKKVFIGDIQTPEVWEKIKDEHFDFIICSHTLEDIKNPKFVIENIIKNSKEGFISIPNKHTEMSHVESLKYLGYCHHQYIFTLENDTLYALRKFPLLQFFIQKINLFPGYEFVSRATRKFFKKSLLYFPAKSKLKWVDRNINMHDNELAFLWEKSFNFEYLNDDFLSSMSKYLNIIKEDLGKGL